MPRIIPFVSLLLVPALWGYSTLAAAQDTPAASVAADQAQPSSQTEQPMDSTGDALPQVHENAPDRYIVQKGDTLWGISSRFLKNPWKWPDIWGMNQESIHNPHLIYPGDIIILDKTAVVPRLRLEGEPDGGRSRWSGTEMSRWSGTEMQSSTLKPQLRSEALSRAPIPPIPAKAIEPFLIRPLVMDQAQVNRSPRIVVNTDARVVIGAGDLAYVQGLDQKRGTRYQIFRPGRVFQDPDTRQVLGYEAIHVGEADVLSFGEISSVRVVSANQEITVDDRLTIAPKSPGSSFIPHAPEKKIRGRVIAGSDSAVAEIGALSVVILNRGAREGLETGHVLGLYRSEAPVIKGPDRQIHLPEQRYGLLLIFRVFDRLSYGLVLTVKRPVNVLDAVANP